MLKALFFGAASVSSCNTVYPVLDELSSQYKLIAYNCEGFSPPLNHRYTFRAYPPYEGGYHPTCMDENTSYLQFGEILIDTAASLSGYIVSEIEREKPDFILYSHLAVWGRLVANHFDIPAISMFNTFVMDKRVMLSYFRKNPKNAGGTDHLKDTIRFSRKLARLHDELKVSTEPDIWDIYVNPGGPNLSCILENFQPSRQVLGPECKFIGFPGEINGEYPTRDIIYVAMGTILNRNEEFYKL